MEIKTYKIKKSFLIPFSIDIFLLAVLFLLSFFTKGTSTERGVLVALILIMTAILVEAANRRTTTDEKGIAVKKFFREKHLLWAEITQADSLIVRSKVYLLLTSTKGYYILSNAYDDFIGLVRNITINLEPERVADDVKSLIDNPVNNQQHVIASWVMAFIIMGIIAIKIYPFFK